MGMGFLPVHRSCVTAATPAKWARHSQRFTARNPPLLAADFRRVDSRLCIDDVWIRFTARGTGYSIGIADTSVRKPGVFVGRCCMYVTFNAVDVRHDGQIVCETAVGVWSLVSTISFDALADGAGTCADCRQSFTNRKLQLINGYGMHFLFPTIKNGVLKKVQLRSWGEGSRFDRNPAGARLWKDGAVDRSPAEGDGTSERGPFRPRPSRRGERTRDFRRCRRRLLRATGRAQRKAPGALRALIVVFRSGPCLPAELTRPRRSRSTRPVYLRSVLSGWPMRFKMSSNRGSERKSSK